MAINDISLTAGMRSNLLSLQNTVTLLNRTQGRLSTGNKVNSALDNPTSYFAAQALNSRASVIDGLKDAMGQAIQTVQAADKGVTAITVLIQQAKGLAQSAQSAKAGTTAADVTLDAKSAVAFSAGTASIEVSGMTQEVYANVTLTFGAALTSGDVVTIDGHNFTYTTATGANNFSDEATFTSKINAVVSADGYVVANNSGTITITLTSGNIDSSSITGTGAAHLNMTDNAEVAGSTFDIGATILTAGIDFTDAASLVTVLSNAGYDASSASGTTVTAAKTGVTVLSTEFTSSTALAITTGTAETAATVLTFTIAGNAVNFTAVGASVTAGAHEFNVGGTDQANGNALGAKIKAADTTVNTATANANGLITVTYNTIPSDQLTALQTQYNDTLAQITALAEDSGYQGKNLLSATANLRSLTVQFESSNLTVSGFDATATGLNLTNANWTNAASITGSITSLDNASATLSSNSSSLAGNLSIITVRQDFSTNMVNTLTDGASKLTLADTNEEGANMLMLQTRQSLGTTALSLSSQAAQAVLRLFQ